VTGHRFFFEAPSTCSMILRMASGRENGLSSYCAAQSSMAFSSAGRSRTLVGVPFSGLRLFFGATD
jgi:hypothetical protein